MARPSMPVSVLSAEKKTHLTKAQIEKRKQGEESLSTGTELTERSEVKKNKVAHAEFKRLNGLLGGIGKNDAIYETVINRYCMILSECVELEVKREKIFDTAEKLEKVFDELSADATFTEARDAARAISDMYAMMLKCDKQVDEKRKMLLSIEKENIMTVAAALRSVPKDVGKKENPLLKALTDD